MYCTVEHGWHITQKFRNQTDVEYHKKYSLNWVQCIETRINRNKKNEDTAPPTSETGRFEYVTGIKPDSDNVRAISFAGRLRWKIENEGFNTQKNGGYELEHKYNRNSYNGLKNYCTLLQIAHAVNQLVEKGKTVTLILKLRPKESLRNLWNKLKGYMIFCKPDTDIYSDEKEYLIQPAPT